MLHVMYMTPTLRDAIRIGCMAKRIHGEYLPKCVAISDMDENNPVYRDPQFGRPRVRVRWMIGTQNLRMIEDKYAWDRAIYLYENYPYWLAYLISWLDHFRTKWGTRVAMRPEHTLPTQGDYIRREEERLRKEKELKEKNR